MAVRAHETGGSQGDVGESSEQHRDDGEISLHLGDAVEVVDVSVRRGSGLERARRRVCELASASEVAVRSSFHRSVAPVMS
jgi:hypothetical protein